MATKHYVWFGMKLTPGQKEKIERLAEREGVSQKAAIIRLVDEAIRHEEPFEAREGSVLDGVEHLIGSVDAPHDLSTNPKYMRGFGRD